MTKWKLDYKSETPIRFLSVGDFLYSAATGMMREIVKCYAETFENGEFTGLFIIEFTNGDRGFYNRNSGISEI